MYGKSLEAFIYEQVRGEAPHLYSSIPSGVVRNVISKFNKEKKEYLKGTISIPSYKSNYPIPLVKKQIAIKHIISVNSAGVMYEVPDMGNLSLLWLTAKTATLTSLWGF